MPVIYFLRHGQTDWNASRRMQGQIDTPLNDVGRAQAARNGRALATLLGDAAAWDYVSSPLVRASETMEIVRETLGLPRLGYATDKRLMEIHFGDWQGELWENLGGSWSETVAQRLADPWNHVPPGEGAESNGMLSERVLAWLSQVSRDTVAVAHGGVMRVLRAHIEGLDVHTMIALHVPQDQVLRIDGGHLSWH
ncbi:MAG: histidine phosphatase family protein [Hyphomicrobiales bacterium]|nr:histidine phosphatase family protein [Hyphomicrobiales bacterium]